MDPLNGGARFRPSDAGAGAHRLVRWQRLAFYAVGAVLVATGVVWLVVRYGAVPDELPPPIEAWSLRLHGLAAFAGLFVMGALAAAHIPQGWRLSGRRGWRWQRQSGATLCVLGVLLVASGYLLYYFASEGSRPAIGWVHAAIGAVMAVLVVVHRRGARPAGVD